MDRKYWSLNVKQVVILFGLCLIRIYLMILHIVVDANRMPTLRPIRAGSENRPRTALHVSFLLVNVRLFDLAQNIAKLELI